MRVRIALLALAALAGCGSKEAKKPQGSSFGQVLPGSASDAMLPFDTASSAPPLDERQYDPDKPAAKSTATRGTVASEAANDGETAPEASAT